MTSSDLAAVLIAIITTAGTLLTTLLLGGKKRNKKLDSIHVLVNSRLTAALQEIHDLRVKLGLPSIETPPADPPVEPTG